MSLLKVRMVTPRAFSIIDYMMSTMDRQDWVPGMKYVDSFLTCDPTGVFVGELKDKPIGFVSFLKYTESYCSMGSFYLERVSRLRLWQGAIHQRTGKDVTFL